MINASKWEYKTVKFPASGGFMGGKINESALNDRLNEIGEQGYELTNSFVTHQGYGSSRDVVLIFKRERR